MTRSRPLSCLSRRALAESSSTVMPGESSTQMSASWSACAAISSLGQSDLAR